MSDQSSPNALNRLFLVGNLEAISFLLLLGVAMPLKYMAGMPMAVSIVGMAHGVLFIAYLYMVAMTSAQMDWPWKWSITLVTAALLPFGPFMAHRWVQSRARPAAA